MKNESSSLPVATTAPAAGELPGVSAGSATVGSVSKSNAPVEAGRLNPSAPAAASVIKHGGKKGGRPRDDGLVPGSPEAIAADRKKEAERSSRRRAEKTSERVAENPPRLSPLGASVEGEGATKIPVVDGPPVDASLNWVPADFNQVAVDTIELADLLNIQRHIKRRQKGNLAHSHVANTAKDVGIPAKSKESLQSSSPASLAWAFNAAGIPILFKPFVSTFPALTYLVLRDFAIMVEDDKLIAAEKERSDRRPTETPKP